MAAYDEILTIDEFIIFGEECDVIYFLATTYKTVVFGPITFMTH